MLTPRSAYPRTWRQLRPELAATAAAGAALLQAQLPQLADKQRVDAELETLAALSDAIAAYREVLAEAEENDAVYTLRAGMSAMKNRVAEQRSIIAPTTWLLRST